MMEANNQDWLDLVVANVIRAHPEGKLTVSSGHSPSGTYHIGTMREIMTANAIAWALRRAAPERDVVHLDVVDDYDAFRKVPSGVPEGWKQYVGVPLAVVPDPFDCHASYGAHYLDQLNSGLKQLGVVPDVQLSGFEDYRSGALLEQMRVTLDKLDEVRQILVEVGKRDLEANWSPVQILDEHNNLRNRKFTGWDASRQIVTWIDKAGTGGETALASGEATLGWRLDWPARWAKWGVSVEPFGRDHATKGGSYDTGKVLVERIFGGQAPDPVPYEFINTVGETKKMSKSAGNVLTPGDALEVMPPEILRYFVIKARPSRTLFFDSGLGLYALIDEYSKAQVAEPTTAMSYARAGGSQEVIARVPFSHLVGVYQAARFDMGGVGEILRRTGYEAEVEHNWPVIERELGFVKHWLEKYAPESVIFTVQETLPEMELSAAQRAFLAKLAKTVEAEQDLNGQGMHDAIYAAAEVARLKPGQAFVALYRVILGQDAGPKAGWFLASLDREWLVKRLREAAIASLKAPADMSEQSAALPDGRMFKIDPMVMAKFPAAVVGFVVADIQVKMEGSDWSEQIQGAIDGRQITREDLISLPEIRVWREAYKEFGVKPSDYRSSVEALLRRAMDGAPVQVNSIVDAYNFVSLKHLVPMGAMDLDMVDGDIELRFGREGELAQLLGVDQPVEVTPRQVVYADDGRIITWLWNYRDAKGTAVTLKTKRAIFFVDSLTGPEPVQAVIEDLTEILEGQLGAKVIVSGCLPENLR